jgi:hypothetical protein
LIWSSNCSVLGSFEPYTKVGVIVPVSGNLTIETTERHTTPSGNVNTYSKEKYCQTQL